MLAPEPCGLLTALRLAVATGRTGRTGASTPTPSVRVDCAAGAASLACACTGVPRLPSLPTLWLLSCAAAVRKVRVRGPRVNGTVSPSPAASVALLSLAIFEGAGRCKRVGVGGVKSADGDGGTQN